MNEENRLIIEQLNKFGRVPETYELLKTIEDLEQENQKYKEVIENAIQFIKDTCIEQILDMPQGCYRETASIGDLEELLAILEDKEVE